MKKLLISLAFLPFALAIIFAAKTYWAKLWPDQTQHIVSDINSPNRTNTSERTIQSAHLLDGSGSMDGLIEKAKAQLWNIVNQLSDARYEDEYPNLHISLYIYGGDHLSYESGYVKQLTPFTSDLDLISEELFALTTNGGEEYCGQVIKASLDELEWSSSPKDLKLVFIAGNEPFSQGPVPFREVCKRAAERDIY
ncbi:MAG: VWA domain-containing protein, partial [Bacteroidetes bacterium]|nr:VWA domain-containing protein [Bacteroidota bacterium]